MTPLIVSTPASLLAALKTASAGALILLTPGPWDSVTIQDIKTPGTITIRSQDTAHPAVIAALTIQHSEGIDVSDLTLATELYNAPTSGNAPAPFKILGSKRINMTHLSIHGTLDNDPQDDVTGLLIVNSDQIVVSNCEIQQFFNGLPELNNDHISIMDNDFHDIRSDGIENAGSSNVTISGNHFTDFYPVGAVGTTGDHPDAIQFWTSRTKAPAHDILISNNTYVRGRGHSIQGIFVTDQIGMFYQNVTIKDNRIEGASYNGIMAAGCKGVTITGNYVQPYPDEQSWIRVQGCSDITITDNHAGTFFMKANGGRLTSSRNAYVNARRPKKIEPGPPPHDVVGEPIAPK